MPRTGYKSITVSEDLYNEIRRLARSRGTTPPRFLRELLSGEGARRKKGLGNPDLARQSPADLGRARRKGKVAIVKEKKEGE